MQMGVKPPVVPKTLIAATQPHGGIAGGTGVIPPLLIAEPVQMPPPEPVKEIPAEESINRSEGQLNSEIIRTRLEDEVRDMPKLAPLPGFDYKNPYAAWKRTIVAVANHYELEVSDIMGPRRARHVVQARFECMYRMRVDLRMSFLSIAEKIGRDHSTVIHGVNTIRDRLLDAQKKQMQSGKVLAHGMVPRQDVPTLELAAA